MSEVKSASPRTVRMMVLAAAVLLVVGIAGVVQSTQAQLVFMSENYVAEFAQTHIGVALTENDVVVEGDDALLADPEALLGGDAQMIPGKAYAERLSAVNTTDMGEYVRLTVRKYWAKGAEGDGSTADTRAKTDKLDPSLIQLQFTDESAEYWVRADNECTAEREVFYYKTVLPAGEAAEYPAVTGIRIDPSIKDVREDYSNCWLALEAQVDSVQVNNAVDAAKSAWGVDVTQEAFAAAGLNWSQEG